VEDQNAVRAVPCYADDGPQRKVVLGDLPLSHTEIPEPKQEVPCGPSPDAIAAARDLVFEGLIEAGSLAESYSRSLTEAAWRGDRSTVEVHLRQLRACVVASIDIFKQFDGVEAKGPAKHVGGQ
jgi:hypothetical protein